MDVHLNDLKLPLLQPDLLLDLVFLLSKVAAIVGHAFELRVELGFRGPCLVKLRLEKNRSRMLNPESTRD